MHYQYGAAGLMQAADMFRLSRFPSIPKILVPEPSTGYYS